MTTDADRLTRATPTIAELSEILRTLGSWQSEDSGVPLHPGDIGWFWRLGPEATAAAVRVWRHDGRPVAIGLLDGADVLRLALAPDVQDDAGLADAIAEDVRDPGRGVLPTGSVAVEARTAPLLRRALARAGWEDGEAWVPLVHRLTGSEPGRSTLRVEVAHADTVADRLAVHRSAFAGSSTDAQRWTSMASGPAYAQARCLTGYDANDAAVAAVTVWSAGPGRPGLIEPLAVHRDHRGHGHGAEIARSGVRELAAMGASCVFVATPASNIAAVATYVSAGFERLPDSLDIARPA